MEKKQLRVEVILPFCPNTCQYCSMPSDYETARLIPQYCHALEQEIVLSSNDMDDYMISSIHLGGGIASYVKAERVCSIIEKIKNSFTLSDTVEISIRTLLGYMNEFKIKHYLAAGITKVDVDYHINDPAASRYTGRTMAHEKELKNIRAFTHYGLNDVGYELYYGIPGETLDSWKGRIKNVLSYEPAHLSLAPMSIPSTSKLRSAYDNLIKVYGDRSEYHMADTEHLNEMHLDATELLIQAGFTEYLPKHFALPQCQRQYLIDKAQGIDLLSFGAGGMTILDNMCSTTVTDIALYTGNPGNFEAITEKVWLV